MREDVRYILNTEGINPNRTRLVRVSPMPEWLQMVNQNSRAKYCHINAYSVLLELKEALGDKYEKFEGDVKYVLGFIANEKVHEHAFLKIADKYYDPTISEEVSSTIDTYSLVELSLPAVQSILERTGMVKHGLLLMTLRDCDEFAEYFTAPTIEDVISEVQKVVDQMDSSSGLSPSIV